MKIVIISDTHSQHEYLPKLPQGDILLHCGDWSVQGNIHQTGSFLDWFSSQPHQHKIMIAGNHDFLCEREPHLFQQMLPENICYLEDSGVTIEGIKIWGTPHSHKFCNWAFNQSSYRLTDYYSQIPADTQILVSHAPPYGILDRLRDGTSVGEPELLHAIGKLDRLKLVAFGHIHESFQQTTIDGVQYFNAALLDEKYRVRNKPWIVDFV